MIRLRSKNGSEVELDKSVDFIELCDSNGGIGYVFYSPEANTITKIEPNTEESKMYSDRFNVEFVRVIDIRDRYKDNE
jgi:hypothetical protein